MMECPTLIVYSTESALPFLGTIHLATRLYSVLNLQCLQMTCVHVHVHHMCDVEHIMCTNKYARTMHTYTHTYDIDSLYTTYAYICGPLIPTTQFLVFTTCTYVCIYVGM